MQVEFLLPGMTDAQIFQILGIVYFAVGLGILISPRFYAKMMKDLLDNRPVIYLSGFITITLGYFLVTFHNSWSAEWGLIITILGWVALLKGVVILLLPKTFIKIAKSMYHFLRFSAAIITIGGALLIYLGYFGL